MFLLQYQMRCRDEEQRGSVLNQSGKQRERPLKLLLLLGRESLRDPRREPVLPRRPALLQRLQAFGRQGHQCLAAVAWIRCSLYEAGLLQRSDDSAHGLWAHPFSTRQAGYGSRAVPLQAKNYGGLGRCKIAVPCMLAQTQLDLPKYGA